MKKGANDDKETVSLAGLDFQGSESRNCLCGLGRLYGLYWEFVRVGVRFTVNFYMVTKEEKSDV